MGIRSVEFINIDVYNNDMKKSGNIANLEEEAASQWGMFTSARAIMSGVSRTQLSRMVANGRIEPMSYGVYRFTAGAEVTHADIKAAWLSTRPKEPAWERLSKNMPDIVVAARTAAFLNGGEFHPEPLSFAVGPGRRTARDDVRYLPWNVEGEDVVPVDGLPTTSVERTIADLIRLREDPSLVDGFMHGVAANHDINQERLAVLLVPLAQRNGYGKDDGETFALDLWSRNVLVSKLDENVSEFAQIAATISRSANLLPSFSEYYKDALGDSMKKLLANIRSPEFDDAMEKVLAAAFGSNLHQATAMLAANAKAPALGGAVAEALAGVDTSAITENVGKMLAASFAQADRESLAGAIAPVLAAHSAAQEESSRSHELPDKTEKRS